MRLRSATTESASQPSNRPPEYEPGLSAEERADRTAYPFLFITLAAGVGLKGKVQEQSAALQRAAAEIPTWHVFRRLAGADVRWLWANTKVNRNTVVQNRKAVWRRIFRRFAKLHGLPGKLVWDRAAPGHFIVRYAAEDRSADGTWTRFLEAAEAIGMREELIDAARQQFEIDCAAAAAKKPRAAVKALESKA